MKKMSAASLLVLGLVASAGARQAFADAFMQIPGIKGSSVDGEYPDWIEVVSLTQTAEAVAKATGAAGSRSVQCSLEVVKHLDVAGPKLWAAAVTGRNLGDVQIDVRTQGNEPQVTYRIILRGAMINAITTSGEGEYVERVVLVMNTVQLTFFSLREDGSRIPTVSTFSCKGPSAA